MLKKPTVKCCALIVAGGQGRRFGGAPPKQFVQLGERPILAHTLDAFERCPAVHTVVLVVAIPHKDAVQALLEQYQMSKVGQICPAGKERWESVQSGLSALPSQTQLVAIHDGARPLVTPELIASVVHQAHIHGAAVPVLHAQETIKKIEGGTIQKTLDRDKLAFAQTPQVFAVELIRKAFMAFDPGALPPTDDAQLIEALGQQIHIVAGDPLNLKITTRGDLLLAEAILQRRSAGHGDGEWPRRPGPRSTSAESPNHCTKTKTRDKIAPPNVRIGTGYDAHRLVPGRALILGGVEVPSSCGLLGHSDGDVLCHAIGDALLGAACLGDLGLHFPSGHPKWRDANSLDLLAQIMQSASLAGYSIGNIDATILCETPRLAPYIPQMRRNIADALAASPRQINIKATSTEKMGFVGKEEGLAAQAAVLVLSAR